MIHLNASPIDEALFLHWVADRLVHVHGENKNVDFVIKLRNMARGSVIKQGGRIINHDTFAIIKMSGEPEPITEQMAFEITQRVWQCSEVKT